ncbi:hypothetical protein LguiB_016770 [Lonicera macranthoides]
MPPSSLALSLALSAPSLPSFSSYSMHMIVVVFDQFKDKSHKEFQEFGDLHLLSFSSRNSALVAVRNISLALLSDNMKYEYKEDGISVDIKFTVKHVLSRELQQYFEKITELTVSHFDSTPLFKDALLSLGSDSALQPLVPYFSQTRTEITGGQNGSAARASIVLIATSIMISSKERGGISDIGTGEISGKAAQGFISL